MTLTVLGAIAILAGLSLPPAWIVDSLRSVPAELLRVGVYLFKASLVVVGAFLLTVRRLGVWRDGALPEKRAANRGELVAIGAILAAATVLRLPALNSGLWLDEILTYVNYARMPFVEIVTTYASENQHFLYTLGAHAAFVMFGESAFALRLPAVIFGVLSIWAVYLLGRTLSSVKEALITAALLACSYHHIWFSQNARGYTGLLFWTLFSSWLFVLGLRESRPRTWIGYAVAASLGVYTHITMLFVIAGQFLIYATELYRRRREPRPNRYSGLLLGFTGAGLLTFQLHALVLPQVLNSMHKTVSVVSEWKNPLWTALEIARGLEMNFAGGVVALVALTVFLAGLVSYWRTDSVLVKLLFIPPVLGAALVVGVGHHLWPRFFFFAMGFGALVAVRGTRVLGEAAARPLRLSPAVGTAGCLAMVLVSALSIPKVYGPKQDYVAARAFVEANRLPGDAIVTVGLASFPYKEMYKLDWDVVETMDQLNAVRSRSGRTWVLYTLRPVLESTHPEIASALESDFHLVKRFPGTLQEGTVFVSRAESPVRLSQVKAN
jgi:mannosyltransferase